MRLPLEFDMHGEPGDVAGSARLAVGFNLSCCPFCRGNNVEVVNTWTPCYWVECHDCDTEGPKSRTSNKSSFASVASAKSAHRRAITKAVGLWEGRL